MIRATIHNILETSILNLGFHDIDIQLTETPNKKFGDYATNIALQLAKAARKNPLDLADEIIKALPANDFIEKAEKITPGFINLWISDKWLLQQTLSIEHEKHFSVQSKKFNGEKILIEYTDPNPFKEFHVGHLYSNIVGESLARLLEANGASVQRVNYQGDVGMHVAKAVWGLQKKLTDNKLSLDKLADKELHSKVAFLGAAYVLGSNAYEHSKEAAEEIKIINKKVYDKDSEILPLYEAGRTWSLDYFEEIYRRLGNNKGKGTFDDYYFESEVGQIGLDLVNEYLKKGIFKNSDGAVIFEGKKIGLHNRVFINSLGLPTYEAKELGLAIEKDKRSGANIFIVITGNEIVEYFKVLIAALTKINPQLASKVKHIAHGMVVLPSGKMSSRSGNIIQGTTILDEAEKLATERIAETSTAQVDLKTIAPMIAAGAIKYALLKNTIGSNIEFSFDDSISFKGNSGPYLQYTYVRCQSILKNTEIVALPPKVYAGNIHEEEREIMLAICLYPEVVESAAQAFEPHLICTYLYDLSQKFNLFYEKHPVLQPDTQIQEFRLFLIATISKILKEGLYLLGIEVVERM